MKKGQYKGGNITFNLKGVETRTYCVVYYIFLIGRFSNFENRVI